MKIILIVCLGLLSFSSFGQVDHQKFIRQIYDIALEDGHAYENLRSLCKDIGSRNHWFCRSRNGCKMG